MAVLASHPSLDNRGGHRLSSELERALERGTVGHVGSLAPRDHRDALLALLTIYDLHLAPLQEIGARARFQHHPGVASLKWQLEELLVAELDDGVGSADWGDDLDPTDPVASVRAVAAREQVPAIYAWLATDASREEVLSFLRMEGGPDGGFDDLVAACQIGLNGAAKLEMAVNYWDEMGNGSLDDVHTELHRRMATALELESPHREFETTASLRRAALGGLLATNRHLQPEMVGALGVIELQAGPRCRRVLAAFDRLDLPEEARPFYEVHAAVDPRHGKDWLDNVVATLADAPGFAEGMVRGAQWRVVANRWFFTSAEERLRS